MGSIQEAQALPAEQRSPAYSRLAAEYVGGKDVSKLLGLVEHLILVEGESQHQRTFLIPDLLREILELIQGPTDADAEVDPDTLLSLDQLETILTRTLDILHTRQMDFPDALRQATQLLAECYQASERFTEAANTLARFDWSSDYGKRAKANPKDIVLWHLETAEFYLDSEDNDVGRAVQQVNKSLPYTKEPEVRGDKALMRRLWVLQARHADNARRFLEASKRYLDLSRLGGEMTEEEVTETLRRAVTCAILGKAGPARSRTLAVLYSDPRTQRLGALHSLLEKVYMGRFVRQEEINEFSEGLAAHQKAVTGTGRTVVQNAMMQHNLEAASRVYENITFQELGLLLGITAEEAESLACSMVQMGQMRGAVDQVGQVVEFMDEDGRGTLGKWDDQIERLCLSVNSILEGISRQYPQYEF